MKSNESLILKTFLFSSLAAMLTLTSYAEPSRNQNTTASAAKRSEDGGAHGGGGSPQKIFSYIKQEEDLKRQEEERLEAAKLESEQQSMREKMKARREIDKARLAEDLQNQILTGRMKSFILQKIQDPGFLSFVSETEEGKILDILLKSGLIEDIKASKYTLQEDCRDEEGFPSFLSTVNGTSANPIIGANICVSIDNFINQYMNNDIYYYNTRPTWLYFGLFIHDHARHFGYRDDNHRLAFKIASLFAKYYNLVDSKMYDTTAEMGLPSAGIRLTEVVDHLRDLGVWSVKIQLPSDSDCRPYFLSGEYEPREKNKNNLLKLKSVTMSKKENPLLGVVDFYPDKARFFNFVCKKDGNMMSFPEGTTIRIYVADSRTLVAEHVIQPGTEIKLFKIGIFPVEFAGRNLYSYRNSEY